MNTLRHFACAASLAALLTSPALFGEVSKDIRDKLFAQADQVFAMANEVRANALSPINYGKAAKLYRAASENLEKEASLEDIKEDLADAVAALNEALRVTRLAEVTFVSVIAARNDALAAQADQFSAEEWQDAEQVFVDAAVKLEKGSVKSAEKVGAKAEAAYREAELLAIKNHYLKTARDLITEANKSKVDKYAPLTLAKAEKALGKAEQSLSNNRYDTDEPRSLAKEAQREAKHAMHLAEAVKRVKDKDITAEEFAVQYENQLLKIASGLNLSADFGMPVNEVTQLMVEEIGQLENDRLELSERRAEILSLEKQINDLEGRIGVQTSHAAEQEKQRQRMASLEAMFSPLEAKVYRQGNTVLMRMIGLNFRPGKSVIDAQNYPILAKAIKALEKFPEAEVQIEGHTDSFGSDALNLKLSQERADAVLNYLKFNMTGLNDKRIRAVGYGETRPVANNELEEGRLKNRRIDIVLRF